jgi:microcystin-dependent protein
MSQPYVGEIRMFAGQFQPAGWAWCNGQLMPISENDTLFNLIGTTYGGDGQETFALPNLQSRVPIHAGTGSSGTTYPIGEQAGVEEVTLTANQTPLHTHPLVATLDVGTSTQPTNNLLAQNASVQVYRAQAPAAAMNAQAIGVTGGSQPHTNIQPYLTVTFIISLFGIYPQPN